MSHRLLCCSQGWLVGLTVKGVGYRFEPITDKDLSDTTSGQKPRTITWEAEAEKSTATYPFKAPTRAVRLKVRQAPFIAAALQCMLCTAGHGCILLYQCTYDNGSF